MSEKREYMGFELYFDDSKEDWWARNKGGDTPESLRDPSLPGLKAKVDAFIKRNKMHKRTPVLVEGYRGWNSENPLHFEEGQTTSETERGQVRVSVGRSSTEKYPNVVYLDTPMNRGTMKRIVELDAERMRIKKEIEGLMDMLETYKLQTASKEVE